jgi:hypothetical protein
MLDGACEQVETLHVGKDRVMRLSGLPVLDFAA